MPCCLSSSPAALAPFDASPHHAALHPPNAASVTLRRFVAFDHRDGDVYLVALAEAHDPDSCAAADGWLAATADRVAAMQPGSAQSTTQRSLQWQHSAAASREAPGVRSHVVPHPRPSAHPRGSPGQPDPARAAAAVSSPGARAEGPDSVLVAAASSAGCSAQQGACPSQAAPDSMATGPAQPARQLAPAAAADPLEAAAQPFRLRRSRRQYQRDVEACLEELRAGNSYELCLTSAIECTGTAGMDPRVMYSHLRHVNPAPHAAFLRFGGPAPLTVSAPEVAQLPDVSYVLCEALLAAFALAKTEHGPNGCILSREWLTGITHSKYAQVMPCLLMCDCLPACMQVCCSSPERFLQCGRDEGAGSVLTARPIKVSTVLGHCSHQACLHWSRRMARASSSTTRMAGNAGDHCRGLFSLSETQTLCRAQGVGQQILLRMQLLRLLWQGLRRIVQKTS